MAAIDDVLNGIKDDSVQAAKQQLQSLLQQAKADSSQFAQQNAADLELWLVQLSKGELDQNEFNALVAAQRSKAEQWVNTQAIAGQARARDLTLTVLDIAVQKIAPGEIPPERRGQRLSGSGVGTKRIMAWEGPRASFLLVAAPERTCGRQSAFHLAQAPRVPANHLLGFQAG